jgi:hypothetical protein
MSAGNSRIRVLLVDFSADSIGQLKKIEEEFDFVQYSTIWNGGGSDLDLQGASVVFVNASYQDQNSSTVHAGDGKQIRDLLQSGGLVVFFLGNPQSFHVANLIGMPISIGSVANQGPFTNCTLPGPSPLDPLFSRFGNRIASVRNIIATSGGPSLTPILRYGSANVGVTAKFESDGGTLVLLPHFGQMIGEIARMILQEILSEIAPNLVYDETFAWIMRPEYLMPSLAEIRVESTRIDEDYTRHKAEIDRRYEEEWKRTQEPWNRLLTTSGDHLKGAVASALTAFGFQTVDVDDYWKRQGVERKDEDLWAAVGFEPVPKTKGTRLVEVKGSAKRTPSDDDYYGALIKYLNRAKTEFSNPDLWGLLIVNHQYLRPADGRREAFDQRIVDDSVRDGVTLVTTYDLFQMAQRLLSGKMAETEIQKLLMTPGRVALPFPTDLN